MLTQYPASDDILVGRSPNILWFYTYWKLSYSGHASCWSRKGRFFGLLIFTWIVSSFVRPGNMRLLFKEHQRKRLIDLSLVLLQDLGQETVWSSQIQAAVPGALSWVASSTSSCGGACRQFIHQPWGAELTPDTTDFQLTDNAFPNTIVNALYMNVLLSQSLFQLRPIIFLTNGTTELQQNGLNTAGVTNATNIFNNFCTWSDLQSWITL